MDEKIKEIRLVEDAKALILSEHKKYVDSLGKKGVKLDFVGAELSGVDFSMANMLGAKFVRTYLVGADFDKANLQGATFRESIINRDHLSRAKFVRDTDSPEKNR